MGAVDDEGGSTVSPGLVDDDSVKAVSASSAFWAALVLRGGIVIRCTARRSRCILLCAEDVVYSTCGDWKGEKAKDRGDGTR